MSATSAQSAESAASPLWTEDPRAVATYDIECAGREDHDFYLALAAQVRARTVVDLGCGTGVFAVDAAQRGFNAIGVDPSAAMLDVARTREGGNLPHWIHGTAADLPTASANFLVMMGHVAQYFVEDETWQEMLSHAHRALVDGGHLAFESRNPVLDWRQQWSRERTQATLDHPDGGQFTSWVEVTEFVGEPGSYAQTHVGHTDLPDGTHLQFAETLRFRSHAEIERSLREAGFAVVDGWSDWDRHPLAATSDEMILLARRT